MRELSHAECLMVAGADAPPSSGFCSAAGEVSFDALAAAIGGAIGGKMGQAAAADVGGAVGFAVGSAFGPEGSAAGALMGVLAANKFGNLTGNAAGQAIAAYVADEFWHGVCSGSYSLVINDDETSMDNFAQGFMESDYSGSHTAYDPETGDPLGAVDPFGDLYDS